MAQSQKQREIAQLTSRYSAAELEAANAVMQVWKQHAENGTLPRGFDYSIDHAVRVARQSGTVAPSASKPVLRGGRLYVSDPDGGR